MNEPQVLVPGLKFMTKPTPDTTLIIVGPVDMKTIREVIAVQLFMDSRVNKSYAFLN